MKRYENYKKHNTLSLYTMLKLRGKYHLNKDNNNECHRKNLHLSMW